MKRPLAISIVRPMSCFTCLKMVSLAHGSQNVVEVYLKKWNIHLNVFTCTFLKYHFNIKFDIWRIKLSIIS